MSEPTLMAEPRDVVGKKVKHLRAAGRLPGIVYGPALEDTAPVTVDLKGFTKFYMAHGASTLFSLQLDGSEHMVFIRDVQVDPVRWTPIHVDFFAPNLLKEITAPVPLSLQNAPEGPGIFSSLLSEVVVQGLPRAIPQRLVVDCSVLKEIGDAIHVSDLDIPDGVTLVTHAEDLIASLVPKAVEPVEEVEAAEGEEAAEAAAEAAAGEAPADESE